MKLTDVARQSAVLSLAIAQIVSGQLSGLFGIGRPVGSWVDPTVVTPADYAFVIWAPIFAGCLAFAVYQARPSLRADPLMRRIGWPAAIAFLGNSLWQIEAQLHGITPATQLLILVIAGGALAAFLPAADAALDRTRLWLVRTPLGLLAGWITVAVFANLHQVLVNEDVLARGEALLGTGLILLAGIAGMAGIVRSRAAPTYAGAVVWGLIAVALANLVEASNLVPGATAALLILAGVAVTRLVATRGEPVRPALA